MWFCFIAANCTKKYESYIPPHAATLPGRGAVCNKWSSFIDSFLGGIKISIIYLNIYKVSHYTILLLNNRFFVLHWTTIWKQFKRVYWVTVNKKSVNLNELIRPYSKDVKTWLGIQIYYMTKSMWTPARWTSHSKIMDIIMELVPPLLL